MRARRYPTSTAWSKTILWGNHQLPHGVIKPAGSAWALEHRLGRDRRPAKATTSCGARSARPTSATTSSGAPARSSTPTTSCGARSTGEGDNIVWGTANGETDNIVWGTACGRNSECDNIVWGTECGDADCDNIVWGTNLAQGELDNIVWGTASAIETDNIVWGTSGEVDNIVWGTSSEADNVTWGCAGESTPVFDDPDVPSVFDGLNFDSLFGDAGDPLPPVDPTLRIRRRQRFPTRPSFPRLFRLSLEEVSNGQDALPRGTDGDQPAIGHRGEPRGRDYDDLGLEAVASGADGVDGDAPRAPALGRHLTAVDALVRGSGALHFAAADDGRRFRALHRVDAS